MTERITDKIKNAFETFLLREPSFIGRQRLITFIVYATILTIGTICNIIGITGVRDAFYTNINILFLASTLTFATLYTLKAAKLTTCLYAMTIISHIVLSAETIRFAYTGDAHSITLAVGTFVLLSLNIAYSNAAYLKYNSYILCAITIAVCIICAFHLHTRTLHCFLTLFTTSFIMVSILGEQLVANTVLLTSENKKYKKDEEEFLTMFRIRREQIKAYIHLAQNRLPAEKIDMLFEQMQPYQISNVVYNITKYTEHHRAMLEKIADILPELTPSELSVCRLVLEGKKQGEICSLLNKTKTNVNTHRAHIRKKLNITTNENLRDALEQIIEMRK